jgi:DNA recombination protein RmuC
METFLYLAIGVIVGLAVGFLLGKALSRNSDNDAQLAAMSARNEELKIQVVKADEERAERRKRDEDEQLLLRELAPLKKRFEELQAEVRERAGTTQDSFTTIQEQLKAAREQDAHLRNTTNALANALAKTGARGSWGELTLERVVESLGMLPNVDFIKKMKLAADPEWDETKERLPDMVIRMPQDRYVAVDSKSVMANYFAAMDAEENAKNGDMSQRDTLMKEYVKDINKQVEQLAAKNYYSGLPSAPEFTIMYMPNEVAMAAAVKQSPALMEEAFAKRIALVTPVTLFAVLKTISYIWKRNEDEKNVTDLIKLGQTLFQQIRLLAKDTVGLRNAIHGSVEKFNLVANRMNGSFLKAANELNKEAMMGFDSEDTPQLETLEETFKDFTATELISDEPVEDEK